MWTSRHLAWFGSGLFPYLDETQQHAVQSSLPTTPEVDPVTAAMRLDYRTYLRDGLLVKLDRAAMLASLETRTPFLDPWVTAFAQALPLDWRTTRWHTKRLLAEAATGLVPRWVLSRRKRGMSVPVATLINGPLSGVGKNREHNMFELGCEEDIVALRKKLQVPGIERIYFDGISCVLITSRSLSREAVLRMLMDKGIEFGYFRDISRSVKQLFEAEVIEG